MTLVICLPMNACARCVTQVSLVISCQIWLIPYTLLCHPSQHLIGVASSLPLSALLPFFPQLLCEGPFAWGLRSKALYYS